MLLLNLGAGQAIGSLEPRPEQRKAPGKPQGQRSRSFQVKALTYGLKRLKDLKQSSLHPVEQQLSVHLKSWSLAHPKQGLFAMNCHCDVGRILSIGLLEPLHKWELFGHFSGVPDLALKMHLKISEGPKEETPGQHHQNPMETGGR